MLGLIFLILVSVAVNLGLLPFWMAIMYIGLSLLTYIAYAIDKSAAQQGKWRTRERTLHFLALIGGWPGALAAQEKLHHKSRKISFRKRFWVTVSLNCVILSGLIYFGGIEMIVEFVEELT
ncbi:MAG: DUF1294 domain-containing protein [Gammaproteobacteria bacterium]|nr:DUF1294 domain-containing protein [Gammaproteobacteria bacterium]MDH5653464.1 DUF1294 domain-containing protein [Gammaproteobacteria bacterium]